MVRSKQVAASLVDGHNTLQRLDVVACPQCRHADVHCRPEPMTEVVEVPDVVPTATPMGVPPVPFMDAIHSAPTATPVETSLAVSQAAPSVINEGSSMEMLGPNLTMTMPLDALEPHSSNPPEPHFVQAAAPNLRRVPPPMGQLLPPLRPTVSPSYLPLLGRPSQKGQLLLLTDFPPRPYLQLLWKLLPRSQFPQLWWPHLPLLRDLWPPL